jgi:hypothetical protein
VVVIFFAPSHELQGGIPLENMLAFIDEAQRQQLHNIANDQNKHQ